MFLLRRPSTGTRLQGGGTGHVLHSADINNANFQIFKQFLQFVRDDFLQNLSLQVLTRDTIVCYWSEKQKQSILMNTDIIKHIRSSVARCLGSLLPAPWAAKGRSLDAFSPCYDDLIAVVVLFQTSASSCSVPLIPGISTLTELSSLTSIDLIQQTIS